jgi:hypothetical protein
MWFSPETGKKREVGGVMMGVGAVDGLATAGGDPN